MRASWKGLTLASSRDEMLASLLYSMQRVLLDTLEKAAAVTELGREIKITGGFADKGIMALKREIFEGFNISYHEDGAVRGNAVLAT